MRDKTSKWMETPKDALSIIEQHVGTQIADTSTVILSVRHSASMKNVIKAASAQEDILQAFATDGGMETVP